MDYATQPDVDYLSNEFEMYGTRKRPQRAKKKPYRTRKGRKPNKPAGYIGQRSNKRLRHL